MKRTSLLVALVVMGAFLPETAHATEVGDAGTEGIRGIDVSNWTGEIDWEAVAGGGGTFAFVYASEGVNYRNPLFETQEEGAAAAGLIRGAYHFAQPHESDGATQADFFVGNGGGWVADGRTLPGVLDVEDNPYGGRNGLDTCYGLDQPQTVAWLRDFISRYWQRTGRDAIIYTTTSWWQTCTGDSTAFGRNPLWLARWGAEPGMLPAGWPRHTFWQVADRGTLPGGQNVFNGPLSALRTLAQPPAELAAAGRPVGRHAYDVTVLNTGPIPATRVSVIGRTFGGQRIVRASRGCRFSATAVRCTIAKLDPEHKARLRFTTRSKDRGEPEGSWGGPGGSRGKSEGNRSRPGDRSRPGGSRGGPGGTGRPAKANAAKANADKANRDVRGGKAGTSGERGRAVDTERNGYRRGVKITMGTVMLTIGSARG
ncbi:lysozyme [Streptosporangium sp. NPDC051023]|uniref:lysozyme n=1 Tax=Streptosporangium sp. NPDC051023 TaxID=3155410 RepID=UPI00344E3716